MFVNEKRSTTEFVIPCNEKVTLCSSSLIVQLFQQSIVALIVFLLIAVEFLR